MTHNPHDAQGVITVASKSSSDYDGMERVPLRVRIVNLIGVVLPFVGLIVAISLLWGVAFNWIYLVLLFVMYLISGLGITIGYHRYFTHKSFQTSRFVQALLAISGSMAFEGSVLQWAAVHRSHHQHSDDEHDPHSPHTHGAGVWNAIRGMWHAHMGWLFRRRTLSLQKYVVDLKKDRLITTMSALFPLWALLGLAIPALLGGLITMSWMGALLGFIWGGLVRVFFVHHVTWSINSVCHIWGTRPFNSHDESRNNPIFGVLGLGEGWHNNHHAFPTSARHGLRWWQLDISYIIIRALSWVGIVWDVRVPSPARVAAKRANA
jgi:stearoyl-CoA desaturase (delta-9 desaturase)